MPLDRTSSRSTSRAAFTVLELVVAVMILAILLAIALPMLNNTKSTGQKVRCVTNLKNIYAATLGFMADHDAKLPPHLGPSPEKHSSFTWKNYWHQQAYLGRYTVGPLNRRKDSLGRFTQAEVEIYQCPARLADGPDSVDGNGNPAITYVMAGIFQKRDYSIYTMESPAQKVFLTEGRNHTVGSSSGKTGALGSRDGGRRLRRYHGNALNVLFYDGHLESFSGRDEELVALLPKS